MRTFDDIMNDPKNHIRLKMQPGKTKMCEAGRFEERERGRVSA